MERQERPSKNKDGGCCVTCQNKLFINRSLISNYKVLRFKSNKLRSLCNIFSFCISDDAIKIKVNENSSPLSITHVDDFGIYFPDVDLSPLERSK